MNEERDLTSHILSISQHAITIIDRDSQKVTQTSYEVCSIPFHLCIDLLARIYMLQITKNTIEKPCKN